LYPKSQCFRSLSSGGTVGENIASNSGCILAHSASIAATATVALLFWQGLGLLLWLCALAVGWARVRTGNHTPLQVLAGFLSALIVVLVVFQLVGVSG